MISHWWQFDQYIVAFVQGNTITLGIIWGFFKTMAVMHPDVKSNGLWELGVLILGSIRNQRPINEKDINKLEGN